MDVNLTALVTASPIAAAVIYTVLVFLKHLKEERASSAEERKAFLTEASNQRSTFERNCEQHRISFEATMNGVVKHCADENERARKEAKDSWSRVVKEVVSEAIDERILDRIKKRQESLAEHKARQQGES